MKKDNQPSGRDAKLHWEKDEIQQDDMQYSKQSIVQRDRKGHPVYTEGPRKQQEGEKK